MWTHPHDALLSIITAFAYESCAWMVLELCDAGSVSDALGRNGGPLNEAQCLAVLRGALLGLAFLHDTCRTIHRDIKAGNLLLTSRNEVKLADFGVATQLTDEGTCRGRMRPHHP